MLFRSALGEVLRESRSAAGLSLRHAARAAGISLGYLSEVERGHKEISSELLTAVCGTLGTDVSDIIRAAADRMSPLLGLSEPLTIVAPRSAQSPADPVAAA